MQDLFHQRLMLINSTEHATPPKFNMEPQNEGLDDVCPFQMGDFQVPCGIKCPY